MSIQEEANQLIEQERQKQAEKDQKINEVLGRREAMIAQSIQQVEEEKQKEEQEKKQLEEANEILKQVNDFFQGGDYTEDELEYMRTPYYSSYQALIYQLASSQELSQIVPYFTQTYATNETIYKNSFYKESSYPFCIDGIGFPIPKRFEKGLEMVIDMKLQLYNSIAGTEFKTTIKPLEYLGQSKTYLKNLNAYLAIISLQKTNVESKTK